MTSAQIVAMAADERISFAVGGGVLLLLFGLLIALAAFGGGREHS
ncbi:MAG TPA: hypothetical protein VFV89_14140 [Nocardioides sp.]|nr:hypothetical protein [Nocardioides sp.]HEX5088943.1 hypothetical protein [Nocardioides sp.]